MDKLRLYIDWSFMDRKEISTDRINPVLYPIVAGMDPKEDIFRSRFTYFQYEQDPKDATFVMIPFYLNEYEKRGLLLLLSERITKYHEQGMKVLGWVDGDFELEWYHDSLFMFHKGHIDREDDRQLVDLPEIPDLSAEVPFNVLPFQKRPRVAFTGQTGSRKKMLWWARNLYWRERFRRGDTLWVPPPMKPHVALRAEALRILEASPDIETDFIKRDRYLGSRRAGREERMEFLENLNDSPYALCVRGGGNFSFRFFEALCLGRIPILIDTETVLPFKGSIDWHRHAVIVPSDRLEAMPNLLQAFHRSQDAASFEKLQKENREIWLSFFSLSGYFEQVYHLLKDA
jgi:hypothetical protein